MIDRTLSILSTTILILAGVLLVNSGLDLVVDITSLPLERWQTFAGGTLLFLSFLLAALNVFFAGHPLYEYWVIVFAASVIAVCYIS